MVTQQSPTHPLRLSLDFLCVTHVPRCADDPRQGKDLERTCVTTSTSVHCVNEVEGKMSVQLTPGFHSSNLITDVSEIPTFSRNF